MGRSARRQSGGRCMVTQADDGMQAVNFWVPALLGAHSAWTRGSRIRIAARFALEDRILASAARHRGRTPCTNSSEKRNSSRPQ